MSLYKKLLKGGYSILAFDYRGFADSTEITDITETTVVHDSNIALQYVRWADIVEGFIEKEKLAEISTPERSWVKQESWCGLTPWVLASLPT